jgi:hypothetical protein
MFDSIFYIVKHPYIHNNVINSTNSPEFENMENSLPNLIGEKFPVIAYVDPATFSKIEALRGDVSRSRFVRKILKKSIEQ